MEEIQAVKVAFVGNAEEICEDPRVWVEKQEKSVMVANRSRNSNT